MSARTVTQPDGDRRVEIRCDTCDTEAPPVHEIMAAHGLNRMGWHCSGGTHICAACPQPTEGDSA